MLEGDHRALVEAVLPVCSRYGLAVAGGYAVKAHGLVERPSEDIDFATGAAAPVGEIVAELAAAYRVAGFTVQVLDAEGRKGHLLVTFPLGGTYRVDVLKEPLNHPVVWMEFGPVIALADAVALKMGALHDRALPRDVLDTHGASSM
jgi:predicted nucleotidyltransferase component of viral defense system